MNKEKQRIAIAEACGWKVIPKEDGILLGLYRPNENKSICSSNTRRGLAGFTPDYLNDLNAMHEAEKLLTGYDSATGDSQYGRYITGLQQITNWNRVPCATAAQRAEALLKTLNLWKP